MRINYEAPEVKIYSVELNDAADGSIVTPEDTFNSGSEPIQLPPDNFDVRIG